MMMTEGRGIRMTTAGGGTPVALPSYNSSGPSLSAMATMWLCGFVSARVTKHECLVTVSVCVNVCVCVLV
jgi:hypothetical protein